jgi:predicted KAP-like P-loop ATPase
MVYGLTGSWGTGKTSLLNLVEQHVRAGSKMRENSWTAVVRFDPWNYTSLEQLISMFFRELRLELAGGVSEEIAREIGEALESLAVLLMPLAAIPGLQAAGLISSFLSPIGSLLRRKAGKKALADVKRQLDRLIIDTGAKLIVLVDDLDRLEPDQVALVLRLIRLNADFANTTYVLAFDPDRTQALLKEHYGESMAEGYVDKIVQVPFPLPIVDEQYVREELIAALFPLFEAIDGDVELEARWSAIAGAGFFDYFNTLRDVKRFVNSIGLTLPLVWGEVNPVDFLATEAIRLYAPTLFFGIHAERDLFLNVPGDLRASVAQYMGLDSGQRDLKTDTKRFQDLLGDSRELVEPLLRALFPQLSTLAGDSEGRSGSEFDMGWASDCRICSMDHFDTYFMLAVPRGRISEEQLQIALAATNSRAEIRTFLGSLEKSGQAEQLLNRFSAHISELDAMRIENTLLALMDVGDELSGKGVPDPDPSYALRISFYILSLIRAVDDRDKRYRILRLALQEGEGIYSVTRLASMVDDVEFKGKPLLSGEEVESLRSIVVERIRKAADDQSLLDAPWPVFILFRWLEWESSKDRPPKFVRTCLSSDSGLMKVIDTLATSVHVHSVSETGISIEHKFPLNEMRQLVPLGDFQAALPRAEALHDRNCIVEGSSERILTEREAKMLKLFIKAVNNPTMYAHNNGPEVRNV